MSNRSFGVLVLWYFLAGMAVGAAASIGQHAWNRFLDWHKPASEVPRSIDPKCISSPMEDDYYGWGVQVACRYDYSSAWCIVGCSGGHMTTAQFGDPLFSSALCINALAKMKPELCHVAGTPIGAKPATARPVPAEDIDNDEEVYDPYGNKYRR